MVKNLIREFTELMRDTTGMIPWISIDEVTYSFADGGGAFYADSMKQNYLTATNKTAPKITSSSYAALTLEEKQFFDYVKNSIKEFHEILHNEAVRVTPDCRFGAMLDYIWNLNWQLRDSQPLEYYATLNNLVAEWFYGIQNQIFTGTKSLQDCYTKIYDLNPSAYHYFNYGRITYQNGEYTIRKLISELIIKGYNGGFLYEYYDIRNDTTLNLTDLTGTKPDYGQATPPPVIPPEPQLPPVISPENLPLTENLNANIILVLSILGLTLIGALITSKKGEKIK